MAIRRSPSDCLRDPSARLNRRRRVPGWLRSAGWLTTVGSLGTSVGYAAWGISPAVRELGLTPEHMATAGCAIGVILASAMKYAFDYVQLGETAILKRLRVISPERATGWRAAIL